MHFLVIRYSGLGDLVMLLPTLKKLKSKYPESKITLFTDFSNRDFYKLSSGLIDNNITINRKVFKEKHIFLALKEIIKAFFQIRHHYDVVIDFQSFGETAMISYLSNAKEKWGAEKKSKYNYGYTHLVPYDTSGHRSQLFARIAHVDDTLSHPIITLTPKSLISKEKLESRLDSLKKTIGLNIGSTKESRRWSEKKFLELANYLEHDYNILVFVGPLEYKFKDIFINHIIIENTTLEELTSSILLCSFFISNDTGPVHIAAALDIPTLTLFSTGDDANVGCLNRHKAFIRKSNIDKITTEEVKSELKKLIFTTLEY
jgi:heptosyltransferase I